MKRWLAAVLVTSIAISTMVAAFGQDAVRVIDQTGDVVLVPQPVERLICVYGPGTYLIYALGAGDLLVEAWYVGVKGISQAWDSMFKIEPRLADILGFGDPNVEDMVARGAQLVFAGGSQHDAFAKQLNDLGIPVIQYVMETPDALKEAMVTTAQVLGPEAKQRAALFLYDFVRITETVEHDLGGMAASDRPRVLFVGTDPLKVASGDMYQTWLIDAAGGVSVSADLRGAWNTVNLEQVLVWDPDVIVIPPYGPVKPADLAANPDWQAVRAVRENRIYRMPRVFGPMDTPVPESLLGVLWLANVLHPGTISLDIAREMNAFYTTYYDYTLTEAELQLLVHP
ncbi:MAG: ABC transporter substrate-binding protein [Thermotogota bacterium]